MSLKILSKAVFVILTSFYISGCATVVTGWYQKILVSSEPSGATVQVDGAASYKTPSKVNLKRNKDHVLVFSKEGYRSEEVKILHVISGAFCGNVFLGGPLGMGVDAITGAQFKLIPEKVHVNMVKE
ncbi:MAG: PEGA domain-containing protein [Candidatus Omnitrophica bacterium]|nr:PEGA domain-containing protein [Candidatus Omnitrophota bacterium]